MFIEINDRLINVDNITTCHIYEEPYLHICIFTGLHYIMKTAFLYIVYF